MPESSSATAAPAVAEVVKVGPPPGKDAEAPRPRKVSAPATAANKTPNLEDAKYTPVNEVLVKMKSWGYLAAVGVLGWLIGHFGWSFFLVLPIVGFFWQYQGNVNKSIMLRDRYEWLRAHNMDRARAESMIWFNTFLNKLWHNGYNDWSDIVREMIQDQLDNKPPPIPGELRVEEFTLGKSPPMFKFLKCANLPEMGRFMCDMAVVINLDLALIMSVKLGKIPRGFPSIPIVLSLSDLDFSATVRVEVEYMDSKPYINKVYISFVDLPSFDFKLKPLAKMPNLISLPGLRDFLMGTINDAVTSSMMGDNKIIVDVAAMNKEEDAGQRAILQVELISGHDLVAKDVGGRSDPYAIVQLGAATHKTQIIKKTVNPVWNEKWSLLAKNSLDKLKIQVFDYDRGSAHDSLGSAELGMKDLVHGETKLMDLPLVGVKHGWVKVKVTYLDLEKHKKAVEEEEAQTEGDDGGPPTEAGSAQDQAATGLKGRLAAKFKRESVGQSDAPSAKDMVKSKGVLYFRLLACKDLISKDMNGKSDPYVKIELGEQRFKSSTIQRNLNPKWLDKPCWEFMIDDPETQALNVAVWDYDKIGAHDKLGSCVVRFNDSLMKEHPSMGDFRDFKMDLEGVKSGKIHFQLNYVPF